MLRRAHVPFTARTRGAICGIATVSLLLAVPTSGAADPMLPGSAPWSQNTLLPRRPTVDRLDNGLTVVTVPFPSPGAVSFFTLVRAGSRDEVEAGKSGYAHLFEHLMFRGSENYTPEQRDALLKRAGADTNASTNQDRTTYYAVFSKEDLDDVLKVEADRFQRLQYAEPAYKTESLAVLGEYNKN